MGYSANNFTIDSVDRLNVAGRYSLAEWKDLNNRKFIVVINVHGLGTSEFPSKTYINGVLAASLTDKTSGEFKKINEINLLHRDDAIANTNKSHHLYYFSCIKGDLTTDTEKWGLTLEFLEEKFIEGIEWGITDPILLKSVTNQSRFKVAESLLLDSSSQYNYAKNEKIRSNHGRIIGKASQELIIQKDFYNLEERTPSYFEFLQRNDPDSKYFTSGLLNNKIATNIEGHSYLAFSYIPSENSTGLDTFLLEQFNF